MKILSDSIENEKDKMNLLTKKNDEGIRKELYRRLG
jgi:hypothetical protein